VHSKSRSPWRNFRNSGERLNFQLFFGLERMFLKSFLLSSRWEEAVLVRRLLINITGRKHHAFDAEVHGVVEERSTCSALGSIEEGPYWCRRGSRASLLP